MVVSRGAWLVVLTGLAGCSLASAKNGAACQRSSECVEGLACVSGKCSSDLSSIAAHNTVPMLGGGRGGTAAGAGGAAAGAGGDAAGVPAAGQGGS